MMKFRHPIVAGLLPALVAVPLLAQPADPDVRLRHEEVARTEAVRELRRQIEAVPLGTGTLGQIFAEDDSPLDRELSEANQLAGPRWLNDDTCQVRLTLEGDELLQAVREADVDVPADQLAGRYFVATGTAVNPLAVGRVQPIEPSAVWVSVSAEARRDALEAARLDALRSVDVQLEPAGVPAPLVNALGDYVAARPVTRVRFGEENGQPAAEVTLSVDAPQLAAFVEGAASQRQDLSQAEVVAAAERLRALQVVAVGRAVAEPLPMAVVLPDRMPEWARRTLTATGRGGAAPTRLLAARRAEGDAMQQFADQLLALPLGNGTVRQAADRDPRVAEALEFAVRQLVVSKTTYTADGGAEVEALLSARTFWDALPR
jgi:hypothetical protein